MEKETLRRICDYSVYFIVAGTGLALWIIIPAITGNPEAWGSNIYYKVGIPFLVVECIVLGYFIPERWWHWGLVATLSQAIFMIVRWPTSNLLPPALAFLLILSIPYLAGGFLGSLLHYKLSRKRDK